jgi:hypothetical protein
METANAMYGSIVEQYLVVHDDNPRHARRDPHMAVGAGGIRAGRGRGGGGGGRGVGGAHWVSWWCWCVSVGGALGREQGAGHVLIALRYFELRDLFHYLGICPKPATENTQVTLEKPDFWTSSRDNTVRRDGHKYHR